MIELCRHRCRRRCWRMYWRRFWNRCAHRHGLGNGWRWWYKDMAVGGEETEMGSAETVIKGTEISTVHIWPNPGHKAAAELLLPL